MDRPVSIYSTVRYVATLRLLQQWAPTARDVIDWQQQLAKLLNHIAGSGPQHHVVERTCPSNNSTIELPIDKLITVAYIDVETVPGFESVWSTRRSFFQFEVSLTDSSTTANMVIATAAQQDNEQSGAGGRRHASWRHPNRKE